MKVDIPVIELTNDEWEHRLEDAQNVLLHGYNVAADVPPTVITDEATGVTHETAIFNGTVNPQGTETAVRFDYGYTEDETGWGWVTCDETPVSGTDPVTVHKDMTGSFAPETKYWYRVRAINAIKTVYGLKKCFVTGAAPTP
jgi:hypothetical protein